jgi:hypothetical protein
MPDGRAAEPPPGSPGRRALGAMESAVRRAREADGVTPMAVPPSGSGRPHQRSDGWLIGSIAVAAALVVSAVTALVVSENTGPTPPAPTAPAAGAPPSTGDGGHATTTSTTVAAVAGGPPVISSLSPASGAAGQAIVVAGSNFLSSSGQIVATFNGRVAPTSCPAQNTCTVTVPASTSAFAQVEITTASGISNAVTFAYG